ncbi:MAG: class B sortase [Oscillospiraceae bacterium]|nr:class B sortase [Oscillospiraceae bacterium]
MKRKVLTIAFALTFSMALAACESGDEIIIDSPDNINSHADYVIGKYYETFYVNNNDFIGYVEIFPWIQYPVYQSTDNDFYLKHDLDKNPNENGAISTYHNGVFAYDTRPDATIIYGQSFITHHMFQPLNLYRGIQGVDAFKFLGDNAVIKFDTLYEEGNYKIFGVFQVNTAESQGEIFELSENIYFENKAHFDEFVADILDRSFYYTNVELQYGDELLLLVTDDFSMFANGADSTVRLIIAARRVRAGEYYKFTEEEKAAFIDNRGVDEDGKMKRKMFEAYYRHHNRGLEWAGRNWDLDYIKS